MQLNTPQPLDMHRIGEDSDGSSFEEQLRELRRRLTRYDQALAEWELALTEAELRIAQLDEKAREIASAEIEATAASRSDFERMKRQTAAGWGVVRDLEARYRLGQTS